MTTQKRRVIYMTDQEWALLQAEAKGTGTTASAVIREAVRFTPCARCGESPARHNPHPLNDGYVGHEYSVLGAQ